MKTKINNFRSFYCQHRFIVALWLILLCFSQTKLSGQTFGNVAMGGGGFVSGVITCKTQQNLIYCRTDVGGAYRWDAGSNRWIPLLDWVSEDETGYLGVESIALDPSNPNNLYMSVGTDYFNSGKSAILRSTDKGATFAITEVTSLFKVHGNGMGRNSGEKLMVDPNKGTILFCGSRSNGLFKSTNSGASWSRVTSLNVTTTSTGNGISFVIFDPSTGTSGNATQTLIVGVSQTGTNLYRSNDGGSTFTAISGAPTNLMPQRAAIASDRDMYITYANAAGPWDPNTGQIWKYSISAGTWTNVTPSGYTNAFSGISVDPNNSERLVASTINTYAAQGSSWGDQIFITTNGGSSWTNVVSRGYSLNFNGVTWMNSSQSIHWASSIEFDPFNTKKVFVNSGNGLFSTENIDATPCVWDFNVKGNEETVALDLVSIPGGPLVSVIGDYDGFINTDPTVYGPQLTPTMGSTNGLAVAALNTSKMVRAGSSLYYSTNTGSSWTQATIKGSQGYVSLSADGNTLLHSPASSSTTYRSTNNGSSWTRVSGLSFSDARTVADQVNSSKFYSYNPGTGRFYVSTNGGTSFTQPATITSGGSKHIRTVPDNEGHVWVALYNGGLVRSTNSGTSFTSISNVTTCSGVGLGKAASGATYPTIYICGTVGGVRGIFRSTDQGASWARINDDAHEWGGLGNGQFIVGDMNVYGRVYMSTVGRGVVYIESGGSTVAVTGVTVSPTTVPISVGGTSQLTATVAPSNATNKTVSWTSSNTSVATVSSSGLVTGVAAGSTIITVTTQDGGKTATCSVTVTSGSVAVTGVTVSPTTASISVGGTSQLTETVSPSNATNKTVSWTSSDTSVASVSSSGLVTGVAAGSATVTVTTQDGGKTATCTVTVTASSGIVSGGVYEIIARHSSKAIGIKGASTANNAVAEQETYTDLASQKFVITDLGTGYYRISPSSITSKALDVKSKSTADGATILQWTYGGANNQQWQLISNENGYYQIKSRLSGKCMDVSGSSTADGASVVQWTCGTGTNQQFSFARITSKASATATEISEVESQEEIQIFPNPSDGNFKIASAKDARLWIYSVNGKLVYSRILNDEITDISSKLESGAYIIKLEENGNVSSSKLFIK